MINLQRLIKLNKAFLAGFIAAALFIGCGKKSGRSEYVAKVNDSYLSKEDLAMQSGSFSSNFYKEEIIRNWINRELLYQQAVKEGILKSDEYRSVMENSSKELAAALYIRNYLNEKNSEVQDKELEQFYDANKNLFLLNEDSYLINKIIFNDEDKAVKYRNIVLENGWKNAQTAFKGDKAILSSAAGELKQEFEIYPVQVLRMVQELYPQEISIVIPAEDGNFAVVQLLQKFEKGTIPPFENIKKKVISVYTAQRKEALISSLIKELYSGNDIKIKN